MNNLEQTRNILVAVDVQHDFIDGSLAVAGGSDIITPLNAVAASVREEGGQVAFTRDWHPTTTPHFDTWPVHCIAGTEGAVFHEKLDIQPEDTIISKGMGQADGYSGWEGVAEDATTLETLITPRTPTERIQVFIGGLATDFCVKATTTDIAAHFADDERVQVYLMRDAIRAVNRQPGDDEAAMSAMLEAKAIAISSEQALTLIGRKA